MKNFLIFLCIIFPGLTQSQSSKEEYPTDSAYIVRSGIPHGEVLKFRFDQSRIFPGTWREYWLYIPAQYKPEKPACVYIGQDAMPPNTSTLFDNLIASGEMPVTIGVFISPGRITIGDKALDRYNRSFEYDGLGDAYARFLLQEILPDIQTKQASDGRKIILSSSGNDRAIGGYSSGAICAFTAAWEKPAEFSRVFSAIGTYVGLRGGERYPTLIRKSEPKPIRIFLQDGSNDLNIYGGDWWKANETMERALSFSGYEVNHEWGQGAHNWQHGSAIFPAALRWLWKDWPAVVAKGTTKNPLLVNLMIPGEEWQLVGSGYQFTEGCAAAANGEIFYQDIPTSKTYRIDANGHLTALSVNAKKASGTAFDVAGNRYTVAGETRQVLKYNKDGREEIVAGDLSGNDLAISGNGNIYITAPEGVNKPGKLFLVKPQGEKVLLDSGLKFPNGIAFTPDQQQLLVTESASHWVWIYQVLANGLLANKQQYGWLHSPDNGDNAWPDGLKCDTAGRVFVATKMGIQVLDQVGRVNAIIPMPGGQPSNLCFGGRDFNILYVTCGDKVYCRKLRTRGINTFETPYIPMPPKL